MSQSPALHPDDTANAFTVRKRLIEDEIQHMARHSMLKRAPNPRLVAVSKKQPKARIEAAIEAGQRVFGENRVQEAQERWTEQRKTYPDLELHLIGPLQSNKVADAVALFDVIQSVDRAKIADRIKAASEASGRAPDLFIQVNTGAEPQKSGVLEADLDALCAHVRGLGLNLVGLMCIPPKDDDPTLHFGLLKAFANRLGLKRLSMGMSADYALAASMGATDIRIGTGLFGERP